MYVLEAGGGFTVQFKLKLVWVRAGFVDGEV